MAAQLGVDDEPPECDDRTAAWISLFNTLNRGRPYTQGHPLPLPPLDILDLVDRLNFPADPDEACTVISALDKDWLDQVDTSSA